MQSLGALLVLLWNMPFGLSVETDSYPLRYHLLRVEYFRCFRSLNDLRSDCWTFHSPESMSEHHFMILVCFIIYFKDLYFVFDCSGLISFLSKLAQQSKSRYFAYRNFEYFCYLYYQHRNLNYFPTFQSSHAYYEFCSCYFMSEL